MNRKLLALSLSSIILAGGIVGGTYAYFNDITTSKENTFSAGTLSMASFRDDIPIEGPMFYTGDSLNGTLGTGLWKPGDSHTRGIYIQNTGSLNGKLNKVYAFPEGQTGTDAYKTAMQFADQSNVIISLFEWKNGKVDATSWAAILKLEDAYIKNHYDNWINQHRAWREGKSLDELKYNDMQALSSLNEALLNQVFVAKNAVGQEVLFGIKEVYSGKLKDLINSQQEVPVELKGVLKPKETMYLGYTVQMQDLTPEVNNPLQGKEVKFNFAHEFIQN